MGGVDVWMGWWAKGTIGRANPERLSNFSVSHRQLGWQTKQSQNGLLASTCGAYRSQRERPHGLRNKATASRVLPKSGPFRFAI